MPALGPRPATNLKTSWVSKRRMLGQRADNRRWLVGSDSRTMWVILAVVMSVVEKFRHVPKWRPHLARPPAGSRTPLPVSRQASSPSSSRMSDGRYVQPVPEDRDAKLAAYWDGWGKGAVPVVPGIYEDPKWSHFRNAALQLLFASPFPEATDYVETRIRELARRSDRDQRQVQEMSTLCHRLAHYHPNEAWPFLPNCSASDDEETLDAVAYALLLMKTEESVTKAKEIIAKLPDNRQSDSRAHWSILNPKCAPMNPWRGFYVRNG